MLKTVAVEELHLNAYRGIIEDTLFNEIVETARDLKGARVLHINSTAAGGGVAEILRSEIPLLNDLGMHAEWQVLKPDQKFFQITKMIHNGLQGEDRHLKLAEWELYQDYNRQLATAIKPEDWDYIVVHDPQPAAVLSYTQNAHAAKWVWRDHLDSRHAAVDFISRFVTYLKPYDGMIFTLEKYIFEGLKPKKMAIIPVAIDPLSPKNQAVAEPVAKKIVQGFGIDISRPLVVQVSRFDPWKDPMGVIKAWELAKIAVPELQLALIGSSAIDDPESIIILDSVRKAARNKQDVFILANRADDHEVNAFQHAADIVLQKSLREGFGLTVSEALWAGTPVIGGNVGGIAEQIIDGKDGYLVDSIEGTAERIVQLVKNPAMAKQMGQWGREYVRQHFLLPRLVRDDLKFISSL